MSFSIQVIRIAFIKVQRYAHNKRHEIEVRK